MLAQILPLVLALTGQTPTQNVPAAPVRPAQTAPRPAPPKTYNDTADAKTLIDTAVKAAATDGIRVLVTFGANDDAGSTAFTKARSAPEIAKSVPSFFADEYKVANIDVGHLDRNLEVAASYGVTLAAGDLPALLVLDDRGNVLARTSAKALKLDADPPAFDPAKIATFLKANQAPAPDANAQFSDALQKVKADGKTLFVWFSAPWCGWCHRLGAWMALPNVSHMLSKEFDVVQLDYDRGLGAPGIEQRYIAKDPGLPYFAFLDGDGKKIADSMAPMVKAQGVTAPSNVGEPNEPNEVAYFKTMLQKVKTRLTDADIEFLVNSLVEFNKAAGG